MATAATLDGLPEVVAASSTEADVELAGNRRYTFLHLGQDVSGGFVGDNIVLKIGVAAITADDSAAPNKVILIPGVAVTLRLNTQQVFYKTAAGAPTMQIIPSEIALE